MAHVEDYFFKFDLIALPKDISTYYLYSLTEYEFNLFS